MWAHGSSFGPALAPTATPTEPDARGVTSLAALHDLNIGALFCDHLLVMNDDGSLDLGCALLHGSFERQRGESGDEIVVSEKNTALIFFAMRMLHRLQELATVPAIDYATYAGVLPRDS